MNHLWICLNKNEKKKRKKKNNNLKKIIISFPYVSDVILVTLKYIEMELSYI
jgi:hypothetical protein